MVEPAGKPTQGQEPEKAEQPKTTGKMRGKTFKSKTEPSLKLKGVTSRISQAETQAPAPAKAQEKRVTIQSALQEGNVEAIETFRKNRLLQTLSYDHLKFLTKCTKDKLQDVFNELMHLPNFTKDIYEAYETCFSECNREVAHLLQKTPVKYSFLLYLCKYASTDAEVQMAEDLIMEKDNWSSLLNDRDPDTKKNFLELTFDPNTRNGKAIRKCFLKKCAQEGVEGILKLLENNISKEKFSVLVKEMNQLPEIPPSWKMILSIYDQFPSFFKKEEPNQALRAAIIIEPLYREKPD